MEEEIFAGTNFRELAFDRENRENVYLAKISRYTVSGITNSPGPFPVRQGGVLSPFLYCLFVDELLDILTQSGLGVSVDDVYCGSPMCADDLALVASSPEELQAML